MRIHWNCDDEAHYTFIALDSFRAILQNKGIRNKLEAWLAFLSADDPEWIESKRSIKERIYKNSHFLYNNARKCESIFLTAKCRYRFRCHKAICTEF